MARVIGNSLLELDLNQMVMQGKRIFNSSPHVIVGLFVPKDMIPRLFMIFIFKRIIASAHSQV